MIAATHRSPRLKEVSGEELVGGGALHGISSRYGAVTRCCPPPQNKRHTSGRILANFAAILFTIVAVSLSPCAAAPTSQQTLESLRLSLAVDYGNPNAHLVFAKSLKERGDALTGFLICEHARVLFGDDAFLSSFDTVFRGHITDVLFHARKQVLQTAINLAPRSVEPLKQMAELYAAHGEPGDAVTVLKRAMSISPDDVVLVGLLQHNLQASGHSSDAETFLISWCQDHPDTPLAWERRVKEEADRNGDAVEQLLDQAIGKFPDDGQLLLIRAQSEEEQQPDRAEADYISAAGLSKISASVQGAAGRFFMKTHHDPKRAIDYYLAAYFIDPDFNDWESASQRIREASDELARAAIEKATELNDFDAFESLCTDSNPLVAAAAIATSPSSTTRISEDMPDRSAKETLWLVTSPCPEVRAASFRKLAGLQSDQRVKREVDQMLVGQDPWARAAAASLVGASAELPPLLHDPSTLVRLHAAIALLAENDAGSQAKVIEAMKKEPSEWLRKLIADAIAQGQQWRNPEEVETGNAGRDQ